MKKALLPALIAALFASHGAFAADRELLFGPGGATPARKAAPEAVSQKAEKPSSKAAFTLVERDDSSVKTKAEKSAAPKKSAVAEAKKEDSKKVVAEKQVAPAVVVKKDEPKAEKPVAVAKAEKVAPVVASKEPTKTAPVVVAKEPVKVEKAVPAPVVAKAEKAPVAAPVVAKKEEPKAEKPAAVVAAKDSKTAVKAAGAVAATAAVAAVAAAPSPAPTPAPAPATVATKPVAMPPMPAVAAAAPVPAPAAVAVKAPDLKPVAMASGSDPFLERERLAAQLGDGIAVGFFPSATGNQDSFSFLKNYLPLANFLSAKTGALVSFVEERNLSVYRRAILESKYPAIFVNATIVGDAIKAGYVPLAMGAEDLGAGFVVLADSRFKSLDDMSGAQFAWSRNAQITMLAQFELANRNLVDKNKYTDLGTSGRAAALAAVAGGLADVGVMRTTEAKRAVEEGNGKYRTIDGPTVWPASGVWIRKDLKDGDFAKKMTAALLEVAPTATGPAKLASEGFSRGFGVKGQFRAVRPGEIEEKSKIVDVVAKSWPDFSYQGAVSAPNKTSNLAMPVFSKNSFGGSQDVVAENAALRTKYKESFNVGFYPSTNASSDSYNFQANFLPLSSYLSEETNYSVSLIPEPNANQFIKRIAQNDYPAIVIGPSMALAAISAGYLPVARGGDFVSPGFLVPAESPIKTIADIAGKRIGTARASDAATVGRWELLKQKVDRVSFDFFGGSAQGLSILSTGAVDGVLLRSSEAEEIVKQTTVGGVPKYRVIVGYEEVPAISAWVRHDVYDYDSMRKFSEALGALSKSGNDLKGKAFNGIRRGYGTNDAWQASGIEEHTTSVQMIEGLIAANQSVVDEATVDLRAIDKIRAVSIVYPNPAAKNTVMGKMAVTKFGGK